MFQHVSVYINHHQAALSLCFTKVTVLTSVTYPYLKLSVLWLHMQRLHMNLKLSVLWLHM